MSDKALFDVVRDIAGRGLTQTEVDQIKAVIPLPSLAAIVEIDPSDMTPIRELERDEGRVLHAYQDSRGFWTIGIGRLIDKRKCGGNFKLDVDRVVPWWRTADPVRRRAIQNIAFNLWADGSVEKRPNTVALMKADAGARHPPPSGRTRSGRPGERPRRAHRPTD